MSSRSEDTDLAFIEARIAAIEARQAARADHEGLARRFSRASIAGARAIVRWLENLERVGPLVQEQLCALIDRDDDSLTQEILIALTLEDLSPSLRVRAVSKIDSPIPGVRAAGISALDPRQRSMPAALCDKIASFATDPDVGVRIAVAYAAGRRRPSVAMSMLDDPDDEVRYVATYMLAHWRSHVTLAESLAEQTVADRLVRPSMRLLAADMFRSDAQVRASHERLAREGVREPLTRREIFFSGAPRMANDVN